jgi:hypothetical protein
MTTESAGKCCTEFALPNSDGQLICKIPSGSNLHVYFNSYISGDGRGENELSDDDFYPWTGEPKYTTKVNNKLIALATTHCEKGTWRSGAAFGRFEGEPYGGIYNSEADGDSRLYSIVDSPDDEESSTKKGHSSFLRGFHWNHHIYCDD